MIESINIYSIIYVAIYYIFLIFGTLCILRTNFFRRGKPIHFRSWHCAKIKYLPRQLYVFTSVANARHGNTRWLVSCSFSMTRTMEVVVAVRGQKRRERASRCLPAAGGFSSEKVGSAEGRKKRREREWNSLRLRGFLIIAIVPQWVPTMADTTTIFFVTWKRKGFLLPPRLPFFPQPLSLVRSYISLSLSLSWSNVTEMRLQSVNNITSLVSAFLFPILEQRSGKFPQTDEAEIRFKLNDQPGKPVFFYVFADELIRGAN